MVFLLTREQTYSANERVIHFRVHGTLKLYVSSETSEISGVTLVTNVTTLVNELSFLVVGNTNALNELLS